jgi:hypothetical protein
VHFGEQNCDQVFFTLNWQTPDHVPITACRSEFIFVKQTQEKLFVLMLQIFCDIFHQNSSC